ncbi:MAG: polyprenyl synthetase family protein [Calditrichota bacterium]
MTIVKKLDPLLAQIQQELQQSIKPDFPQSIKDPINYFLENPGKKIRPLLTLLCAEAVGGNFAGVLSAAVGIELFHDFTLIHDDIMDRDDMRRGRFTIHKKWGEDSAILVGDMIIGMAYEKMLTCDNRYLSSVLSLFNETLLRVCEGQALDKEFETRQSVSIDEYLVMISKKTAWLFKISCEIGALLGGGTKEEVESLSQFGNLLGIGFQIQDDLLDYIGEEKALGKQVGSDLKMHKKTYITLLYSQKLRQYQDEAKKFPESISQFTSLPDLKSALFSLGIVDETRKLVDDYIRRALKLLEKIQPLDESNSLYQMVLALQKRDY